MYPAQAASYSTFVPPYSYNTMFRLLQRTGLMSSDGRCHPDADLYDSIVCPQDTVKVAESDMAAHCQQSNLAPCPPVSYKAVTLQMTPMKQERLTCRTYAWT